MHSYPSPPLILASTSRYRGDLLSRLHLSFDQRTPTADETLRPGEPAPTRSRRLALEKAQSIAEQYSRHWVLGCDQVCALGSRVLRKPETRAVAHAQLREFSGQAVDFHTSIALLCFDRTDSVEQASIHTRVHFRELREKEIEGYLDLEPALDCAGSFKSEGLGISLCEAIDSKDPTALVGLPLISVCRLLSAAGIHVP